MVVIGGDVVLQDSCSKLRLQAGVCDLTKGVVKKDTRSCTVSDAKKVRQRMGPSSLGGASGELS